MMQSRSIRTDLALEAHEFVREQEQAKSEVSQQNLPGVDVENAGTEDIKITRVRVTSPTGEAAIGKPMGNYVTLEVPRLKENDQVLYEDTCKALSQELVKILNLKEKSTILVVGLGNWNVTPDALGPKVTNQLMVTRHLLEYVPEQVG